MRGVEAPHFRVAVLAGTFLHCAGQALQIAHDDAPERHFPHSTSREIPGVGSPAGTEEGAGSQSGAVDILGDRLSGDVVEPDGAVLIAFLMDTNRGLVLIEMKVLD